MTDAAEPNPEFFISRAGADAQAAKRVAHIIEAAGRRVLVQDWDFRNRSFMERMQAALTCGARVIALLSPDYLRSDYCALEWQAAIADDPLNRQSRLIVLRVGPCDPEGLLKVFAYWDLTKLLADPGQEALLRDAVLTAVREGRRNDPLPPATARFFIASRPLLHSEIKPTPNFTGRAEALKAIARALKRGARAAVTQSAVAHGLGGVGKSMLAREFAFRAVAKGQYAGVWWLRAERSCDGGGWDGVEHGLVELRDALYPGVEPPQDRAEAARAALRFIADGGFEKPWLLIYDNVDDEEALDAWAPPANAHTLLTSRLGGWGVEVIAVEVEAWPLGEAVAYLRKASGRIDLGEAALVRLAEELGCLPLALSHAAAYLKRRRTVTAELYLAELSRHMNEAPKGAAYKVPVFATFRLAAAQAEAEAPGALAVLSLAAFFAPDRIPEELFRQDPEIYPEALRAVAASDARLADAIGALDHLSLVDFDPAGRTFSVHRLVQAATLDVLDNNGDWQRAAVEVCAKAYPGGDFTHWPAYEQLLPHALAAANRAQDDIGEWLAVALGQAAFYLHQRAAYGEAEPLIRRALIVDETSLGPQHPTIAIRLNNLAWLLHDMNHLAEAEPLMRRALDIDETGLGSQHPNVAIRLNNLALLLLDTNRPAEAEPLMRRALDINENSFGPQHPNVARNLNNLARLLQDTNRLAEAEPLMRRALAIDESSLGLQHPSVAIRLNNLARLLKATNRLVEAEPLMRRALAILEVSLPDHHPWVQKARNNLAALEATLRGKGG